MQVIRKCFVIRTEMFRCAQSYEEKLD